MVGAAVVDTIMRSMVRNISTRKKNRVKTKNDFKINVKPGFNKGEIYLGAIPMKQKSLFISLTVFFLSFSVLILEISLTRIFSVILAYHYVFMVISLALFGLGVGGLVIHYWQRKFSSEKRETWLPAGIATGYALLAAASVVAIIQLPVVGNILVYFFIALLPFIFAGAFFAKIFRDWSHVASKIYFADLIGAALGSLAFLFFINHIGGVNTALLASGLGVIAALIITFSGSSRTTLKLIFTGILAVPAVILLLNLTAQISIRVPVSRNLNKDLYRVMQTPGTDMKIIDSRWSSFGRTDLLQDKDDPMSMSIFIDGAAGTPMYRFNGDISDTTNQALLYLNYYSGYFPLLFLRQDQKDNAVAIGAGGGRDVLLLLKAGIKQITAVEVNRNAVAIVKDYANFNGGLYSNYPGVNVITEEGRYFLKRSREKYDIIFLSLPISKTGSSLNSFALNENTLFTTGSILDYYDHLTPEGQLVVVAHHMPEIYKLVFTSIKALQERGLNTQQTMKHIMTAGPQMMPVFVLKKREFTKEESNVIHPAIHAFRFSNETMFLPHIQQVILRPSDNIRGLQEIAMMNNVLVAMAEGRIEFEQVLNSAPIDLRPPTDDRPFFYKTELGLPPPLGFLFWLSLGILGIIFFVPFQGIKKDLFDKQKNGIRFALLFLLLGIGFMMIELALFQRFTIYLGQPAMTLSVLLFSLLLGTALGSLFSGLFKNVSGGKLIMISAFVIVGLIIAYLLLLPILTEKMLNLNLAARLLVTMLLILVPGFFMGFPFPTGIRLLKENKLQDIIPWMWGLNGATAVVGAVLSIMIAIAVGYNWVLIIGGIAYFVIGALFLPKKI
ncbi:MAG: hypothetical protein GXO74_00735 [Calditrichaeota bacterium]|nr:hypothetical protein [Calditrichota bacterium]